MCLRLMKRQTCSLVSDRDADGKRCSRRLPVQWRALKLHNDYMAGCYEPHHVVQFRARGATICESGDPASCVGRHHAPQLSRFETMVSFDAIAHKESEGKIEVSKQQSRESLARYPETAIDTQNRTMNNATSEPIGSTTDNEHGYHCENTMITVLNDSRWSGSRFSPWGKLFPACALPLDERGAMARLFGLCGVGLFAVSRPRCRLEPGDDSIEHRRTSSSSLCRVSAHAGRIDNAEGHRAPAPHRATRISSRHCASSGMHT